MVKITIYGGGAEIGGNKILIEDRGARIFLDFGISLSSRSRYYSDPYVSPRSESALIKLGIIPKLEGLYKWDREHRFDAIIISHAHIDHYGYISLVNRGIPVYCGETSKRIINVLSTIRKAGIESDYSGLIFNTFSTGKKLNINGINVKPVHVDHSIPGSYGLIIETPDHVIAYTGDLRLHGRNSSLTRDFIREASRSGVDILLSEATNLVDATPSSENEVEEKVTDIMDRSKGLIAAIFSPTDTDRLTSFYNASIHSNRKLVLSARQAYLLKSLSRDKNLRLPRLDDKHIAVYKRRKKKYEDWEEEVFDETEVVGIDDIARGQARYAVVAPLPDIEALLDLKVEGGAYIYSSSEPFNEEMELDMERLVNWLNQIGMVQYNVHVSGHIMPLELKELVDEIKPKIILPIHTENQLLFSKFISGYKVIEVTNGSSLTF